MGSLTLHAGGAEPLPGEKDGMVVVLRVVRVSFLLHESPATHVLQTPRWIASLDEADGLAGESDVRDQHEQQTRTTQPPEGD